LDYAIIRGGVACEDGDIASILCEDRIESCTTASHIMMNLIESENWVLTNPENALHYVNVSMNRR
jgi:hypothetical protein